MILAVDGTAASGKGTLARRLAAHYGLAYLDTGTLYRAVGAHLLAHGASPSDTAKAVAAAEALDLEAIDENAIRTAAAGEAASVVAAIPEVRAALLQRQRDFAAHPPEGMRGAVLDGRDIGTVVCPEADAKLYVEAIPRVRAHRRWLELKQHDPHLREEDVLADIEKRDARDRDRKDAPMRAADDAYLLDTSNLSIEEAFNAAVAIVEKVAAAKA